MQRVNRFRRLSLGHRGGVAIAHIELQEGVFRQPQLMATHQCLVVHHIDRGQNASSIGPNFDFGECLEPFCPVNRAVPVQVGHVFAVSINSHPAQCQIGVGYLNSLIGVCGRALFRVIAHANSLHLF